MPTLSPPESRARDKNEAAREARAAEALRANLRRRKAQQKARAQKPAPKGHTGKDD